jgi:hypothetical protein
MPGQEFLPFLFCNGLLNLTNLVENKRKINKIKPRKQAPRKEP